MAKQIEVLVSQGVLERVSEPGPSFVSRMFLVKKIDGGGRPIFDLRNLNSYVETREFQLISHAKVPDFIQPGDWLIRVDMSQAYFHIRVASSHRCFLRLLFRGELWQMMSLTFGFSAVPQAFSTVTNRVAEALRFRGLRVIVYSDDFLVACQNKNELVAQVSMMVQLLESLGWQINRSKTTLKPCQDLEFLGIRWNVEREDMSLPEKKVAKIIKLMMDIERTQSCTLKEAQCLLGQLNCELRFSERSALLPLPPTIFDGIQSVPTSRETADKSPDPGRTRLVGQSHESNISAPQERGGTFSGYRCIIPGAGSAGSGPERSPHPPAVGQLHGSFLHPKGGGNQVIRAIQLHVPAPHPGRRAPDSAVGVLPPRKIQ